MRKPYQWNNRARIGICRLCGKAFATTSARRKYCHTAACDIVLEERRVARKAELRRMKSETGKAKTRGKEVSKMGKCGGKKGCKGKGGRCGK